MMDRTTLQVNLAHLAEPPVEIQLEVKAHPAPEHLVPLPWQATACFLQRMVIDAAPDTHTHLCNISIDEHGIARIRMLAEWKKPPRSELFMGRFTLEEVAMLDADTFDFESLIVHERAVLQVTRDFQGSLAKDDTRQARWKSIERRVQPLTAKVFYPFCEKVIAKIAEHLNKTDTRYPAIICFGEPAWMAQVKRLSKIGNGILSQPDYMPHIGR